MMSYTIPRNTGRLQQQKRKKVIHSRIQWIDEIDQIRIFGRWWRRRGHSVVEIRGFVVEKSILDENAFPASVTIGPIAPVFFVSKKFVGAVTSPAAFNNVLVNMYRVSEMGHHVAVNDAPIQLAFDLVSLDTVLRRGEMIRLQYREKGKNIYYTWI